MSLSSRAGLMICAALLASSVLPAPAVAKPRGERTDRTLLVELGTRGSNGYRISVYSIGDQEVTLYAAKPDLSASYAVRGHVRHDRLEANFGKLGRISLRFKPSTRISDTLGGPPNCPPARLTEEFGVFRGSLDFTGEQGFTTVDSHRVRGKVTLITSRPCPSKRLATGSYGTSQLRRAAGEQRSGVAELSAESRSNGRVTSFGVVKYFPDFDEWLFDASVDEQRGRIDIEREALVFAEADSFLVSKPGVHPASAEVIAPKPFQGTAVYAEEPVSPALAWDGSLSVSLPGIGPVPLAGQGFEAFLCSERNLHRLADCGEAKEFGLDGPPR